ncbi:hypothetical protein P5E99_15620 [Clostridium perfringens]|uniref:hypothetical protein n=1 Tax=Clostridium perfringens TaxID=1502 RepID=UPI001105E688|nr:hypothetical protein [Clostridium perfringens]EGT4144724.1 hypothetical protein [Clostridium perfringens]MDK0610356.1 hypothetical protein [Clostridium perfringens]MDK0675358.1 hypothetical protein [Clostridium perfringens]MDM0609253.1 hypothetical protein [Clostridium perfringens]MDM0757999.1 hypothetical protein [Clostridium perfringens]
MSFSITKKELAILTANLGHTNSDDNERITESVQEYYGLKVSEEEIENTYTRMDDLLNNVKSEIKEVE